MSTHAAIECIFYRLKAEKVSKHGDMSTQILSIRTWLKNVPYLQNDPEKGSALSFGKSAIAKVEQNEYVQSATKVVTETVTEGVKMVENAPLVKDFNKEQEKFISENKSSGKIKVPWKGYKDEEQLKEQILTLSKDKRNFLRAPPAGAQFEVQFRSQ